MTDKEQIARIGLMNGRELLDLIMANPEWMRDHYFFDLAEAITKRHAELAATDHAESMELAKTLQGAKEVIAAVLEYEAMPCVSLRTSMFRMAHRQRIRLIGDFPKATSKAAIAERRDMDKQP